ncbi:ATP-binding protein, partial [Crocosphaera chwakensis]
MNNIDDYQIITRIYESANSLVYRARNKTDNKPIVLKILKENYPTPSELTCYQQEYEITRCFNVDNIIKVYDLRRYKNSLVMLLEDFGGHSLKFFIAQSPLSLYCFLTIAINITEGLAAIHSANIIHKDINPNNIIYNPETEQIKIIDFGLATRLSKEIITVSSPHQLEGTLAYISPEQTGRMNRGIDYRSDFYSLGITFYELLTSKLPFETTDPMELIHCHLAQQPPPINQLIPDLPLAVLNIIGKLLAKTPEERYQSAWGIKADLEICLNQLKSLGEITSFPLATQDIAEKFQIPHKLYGRELEVNKLLTIFDEVSQGNTQMLLISGYSGVGKSALVNEIHKPIVRQRGQFIKGKFDQFNRDIPYAAIAQAFRELIHKLLSESEIILQAWVKKILAVLGSNGQIIIEIIPELEKIIGQQPSIKQLGITESQNRFNLFLRRFLRIFCKKEHPLVIFIDDLQWADLPSLQLIEQLMLDPENQYFLLIGTYRDNEVSPTHPLKQTLEKIKQAKVSVSEISLAPLGIKHINQLIADTLNCSRNIVQPLAKLVAQKTNGNPFFLTQLLYSLYQENLLVFDRTQTSFNSDKNQQGSYPLTSTSSATQSNGYWQWDIEQIERMSITDNVVDLMVNKIEKLEQQTQQVLKLAACIGNYFNLEMLSLVNNKSPIETARELQSALNEGLIIPLDNSYKVPLLWNQEDLVNDISKIFSESSTKIAYKFLHDRVQQAAYSLIQEKLKQEVHLKIGQLLLKNTLPERLEENIFDIVNQLNVGADLLSTQLERDNLSQLNLIAAKKAKKSSAYLSALKYLELALNLLSSD